MSKIIRTYTRTFTVEASAVSKEPFMTWGTFVKVRSGRGMAYEHLESCIDCLRLFEAADDIYLCMVVKRHNQFMCKSCRDAYEGSVSDDTISNQA